MRCYARDTVDGSIYGPYSLEDAQAMSNRMANDSVVFKEDIFEVSSSCKKVVTGTVSGGVVDFDHIPDGVEVHIHDYDIEGQESTNLKEDDEGVQYLEIQFGR